MIECYIFRLRLTWHEHILGHLKWYKQCTTKPSMTHPICSNVFTLLYIRLEADVWHLYHEKHLVIGRCHMGSVHYVGMPPTHHLLFGTLEKPTQKATKAILAQYQREAIKKIQLDSSALKTMMESLEAKLPASLSDQVDTIINYYMIPLKNDDLTHVLLASAEEYKRIY